MQDKLILFALYLFTSNQQTVLNMNTDNRKNIGQRIRAYREEKKYTREEFATKLGTNLANLGNIERGEQMPTIPQLQALVSFSYISYKYWLDGVGKGEANLQANEPLSPYQTGQPFELDGLYIMSVPLVNQYAYGGYLRGFGDGEYLDELPKVPFVLEREYKGNYLCFEMRGDSMNDGSVESLIEGDILLCREIGKDLWSKSKLHIKKWKDFVVVHKTEGITVKRIIDHDVEKGLITLHPLNDLYKDFTINLTDVVQILNVVKVERKR